MRQSLMVIISIDNNHLDLFQGDRPTRAERESLALRIQRALDNEYPYARMESLKVEGVFEPRTPTSEETDG